MKTKNDFKIGDHVSVINDTMTGKVIEIDRDIIKIECLDGFLYSFHPKELVPLKDWNGLIRKDPEHHGEEPKSHDKKSFTLKKGNIIKEVDLHIHELTDSEKGMSNYDKLSLQLKAAQYELELAISKKQPKLIFIHGRGEGVLKKELRALCKKYPVEFHDASYTEYGIGATEVLIYQNKKQY